MNAAKLPTRRWLALALFALPSLASAQRGTMGGGGRGLGANRQFNPGR